MQKTEFLKLIDELLELDPGTVQGPELLQKVGWDSLAVVSFIALVDEHLGFTVSPARLMACKTVNDLVNVVAERVVSVGQ
jgi:acyl carrier protein